MNASLNDAPFRLTNAPRGEAIDFERLCREAGATPVVTVARPPDVRIHDGEEDLLAALPGKRIHCLAERLMPKANPDRARYVLERLAYGAIEWASREVLAAERRRKAAQADSDPDGEKTRAAMRRTLAVRRALRTANGPAAFKTISSSGLDAEDARFAMARHSDWLRGKTATTLA